MKKTKKSSVKKTVKKSVTPAAAKKRSRNDQFEAHYLALILIGFLLVQGFLFSATTSQDWKKGAAVLDVSTALTVTVSDILNVMTPVIDTIASVREFYSLAATEMAYLLDFSGADLLGEMALVVGGIYGFYDQASTELAYLLDFSETATWPGQVAGASVYSH